MHFASPDQTATVRPPRRRLATMRARCTATGRQHRSPRGGRTIAPRRAFGADTGPVYRCARIRPRRDQPTAVSLPGARRRTGKTSGRTGKRTENPRTDRYGTGMVWDARSGRLADTAPVFPDVSGAGSAAATFYVPWSPGGHEPASPRRRATIWAVHHPIPRRVRVPFRVLAPRLHQENIFNITWSASRVLYIYVFRPDRDYNYFYRFHCLLNYFVCGFFSSL